MSRTEAAQAPTIDASALPEIVFGHRNLTWWATVGFMVIEGTTLLVLMVSYVYLRRNFSEWPPPPTAPPNLLVPSINLVVLLAAVPPMALARRAAQALDLPRVRRCLLAAVIVTVIAVALRVLEFDALNVRWDAHAYGSVVWLLLGLHSTLLLIDLVETAVIAMLTFSRRMTARHYLDIEEAAMYQFFLSFSWVPLFILIFLAPGFL